MKERIKHLLLLIILIVVDQASKYWVRTTLVNREQIDIIPGVLNLQYSTNTGAVWGILTGRVDFLKILTLMILAVIIYLYFQIPKDKKYTALKLLAVFIVAGAAGNLIDRFYLGYVVDFIYFEIINFPLFNFADSCLTVASILLFIFALFYYKDDDFAFLEHIVKKNKSEENDSENLNTEENPMKETDHSNDEEENDSEEEDSDGENLEDNSDENYTSEEYEAETGLENDLEDKK